MKKLASGRRGVSNPSLLGGKEGRYGTSFFIILIVEKKEGPAFVDLPKKEGH